MARATKPPKRNSWANGAVGVPEIGEAPYVDSGWPAPSGVPVKPPRGYFNFEQNRYDNGLNYLLQRGIPDWDATETDYDVGDIVRVAAVNNSYYQLFGTATPGFSPASDTSNWQRILAMPRTWSGQYGQPIWSWSNAQGNSVSGIDHLGFPSGQIVSVNEHWLDCSRAGAGITANGSGTLFGPWRYRLINGGGGSIERVTANGPWLADDTTHPRGPMLGLNVAGVPTGGSCALVEYVRPLVRHRLASIVFEVEFSVNGDTPPQTTSSFAFGLGDGTLFDDASTVPINGLGARPVGAFMMKEEGPGTVWGVTTRTPAGSATETASSITITRDVHNVYQVQVMGASDGDGPYGFGVARVLHKLNGAVIADDAVSMANWTPTPFFRITADGGPEDCYLNFGPVRVHARLTDVNGVLG
jgi:hypothetical protein